MVDLDALSRAVAAHGPVVRIVIAGMRGSAPRAPGTDMLVWDGGSDGTIGGGRLEFDAIREARRMLPRGPETRLKRQALGPALNQCCGGTVTLVLERVDNARLCALREATTPDGVLIRPVEAGAGTMPDRLQRRIERASDRGEPLPVTLSGGWLAEAAWRQRRPVHIHGAGHVGRALAMVLAPLPQFEVSLIDTRAGQVDGVPSQIRRITPAAHADVIAGAPDTAEHFIMTPEHDLDLELCHHLLTRRFHRAGLIGSATKWARFRKRLAALGHSPAQIARISCPIGDPKLGKHPQAIAVGVATGLLAETGEPARDRKERA